MKPWVLFNFFLLLTLSGPVLAQDKLTVHPDNAAWFQFENGEPFFLCGAGDPEDFLYRGRRQADGTRQGDQEVIINRLREFGVNGIYFQAIRSHGGDGDDDHNPFVNSNPDEGISDAILDQWDHWLGLLGKAGVVSYFFVYDDSATVWETGSRVGDQESDFLKTLVTRFQHHPLIVWVVAEEYEEAYTPKRVSRIAQTIKQHDPLQRPIAVHKLTSIDFSEFARDPNLDQFAIQFEGSQKEVHRGMVQAWRKAKGRYSLNMSEIAEHGTGREARLKSWAAAMGGAYVMVYQMDVVDTDDEDLKDCGVLADFMETTDFYTMEPNDRLATGLSNYVLSGAKSFIAYTYEGVPGEVMGAKLGFKSEGYTLTWLDIRSGRVQESQENPSTYKKGWPIPFGFGPEVALHVTASTP